MRIIDWLRPAFSGAEHIPIDRPVLGMPGPVWTMALITATKSIGLLAVVLAPAHEHPAVPAQTFAFVSLLLITLVLANPWWHIPTWFLHFCVTFGAVLICILLLQAKTPGNLVGNALSVVAYAAYAAIWFPLGQAVEHIVILIGAAAIGMFLANPIDTAVSVWIPTAESAILLGGVIYLLVRRIHSLATRDPLTRTLNRAGLQATVDHRAAKDGREVECSLAVIDLDDFKALNDSQGHAAGDAMLATVAQTMRTSLRTGDIIARSGGDEFLIVLALPMQEATLVMARIVGELPIGASYGVAPLHDFRRFDESVAVADAAMYLDKARKEQHGPKTLG